MTFQSVPVPDADTAPFWEACARRQLRLQRCGECGRLRFPPAPVCHHCRSWAFQWEEHSGLGRVYSWIVVHHPIPPAMADQVPYISAIVELAEGVRMPARLVDVADGEVWPNMPVEVRFVELANGIALPQFAPRPPDDIETTTAEATAPERGNEPGATPETVRLEIGPCPTRRVSEGERHELGRHDGVERRPTRLTSGYGGSGIELHVHTAR